MESSQQTPGGMLGFVECGLHAGSRLIRGCESPIVTDIYVYVPGGLGPCFVSIRQTSIVRLRPPRRDCYSVAEYDSCPFSCGAKES